MTAGAAPDARLPLVVAIHGLGDNPRAFIQFFAAFRVPVRVIAPRGLDPWGNGGYSWFPPRGSEGGTRWLVEGIERATARLADSIASYARTRPTCGRPIVTGFSQGGILSFALAAARPDAIAYAVPMAGALIPALRPARRPPTATALPPVRAVHGEADARISFSDGRATVASLRAAGYDATLRGFPGVGHTIDAAMSAYVADELTRAARAACP